MLAADPADDTADWYYEVNGESVGPVTLSHIKNLLHNGTLTPASLVWAEHLGDWTQAQRVPALAILPPNQDDNQPRNPYDLT